MNYSFIVIAFLVLYSFGSVLYVYKFRGKVRYKSLNQYLRKSWPILAPLNCLLYLTTYKYIRKPVLDSAVFNDLHYIKDNWNTIRSEALELHNEGVFEKVKEIGSVGYYDLGFRTFYKRGWSKFYIKWYGTLHESAKTQCPKTVEIINNTKSVRGAMFSVLPAGSELSLHSDPLACSLRYHLGLYTPNSEECFISIDDEKRVWRDGEDFIFDETYPHFAKNMSGKQRIILMCDIDRPTNMFGSIVNYFYRQIAKGTVVPNTTDDRRGIFSIVLCYLSPLTTKSKMLKKSHERTYKFLKLLLNTTLILTILAMIYSTLNVLAQILNSFTH